MSAPLGNRFWEQRSTHGRKPIFACADDLWNAACEYFLWVENNPLNEEKLFAYQGFVTKESCTKMRAMTIQGLCLFLDISDDSWANYKKKEDFIGITSSIEKVIYQQKFSGAAADLLNANIIARELGLKDSTVQELKGELNVKTARDFTDDELAVIAARSSAGTAK